MKAIVVEDSRVAREGLVRMLKNFNTLEVVGDAEHPIPALELIRSTRPDVIFLDIHMPGETGFDLLEKIDYSPRIIFTTAYSEYAVKSFDYNTIDYLLKPISQERLAIAIAKLNKTNEEFSTGTKSALEMNNKIFIKDDEKCHLVTLESIRYFESCKNYVRVYFNAESAFVKKSLNQIEERLPGKFFFRANRQFIVNLQAISAIEDGIHDGYVITMDDGVTIDISRRQAADLKEILSL
ncbi:MAG: LytTR family DNA-binding domain-containing protein [Cellvibrio sp.]|uniref:LytR/AlgR family response regulator transcription factor n=1 Tax=Cellvibrio sp. TaxID=1965322 RepID=UPI0031A66B52